MMQMHVEEVKVKMDLFSAGVEACEVDAYGTGQLALIGCSHGVCIPVGMASLRGSLNVVTKTYVERNLLPLLTLQQCEVGPPLWTSGQSFWLQVQRSRVRSPALPDFLTSSGSGTGSTQPREPREVN